VFGLALWLKIFRAKEYDIDYGEFKAFKSACHSMTVDQDLVIEIGARFAYFTHIFSTFRRPKPDFIVINTSTLAYLAALLTSAVSHP